MFALFALFASCSTNTVLRFDPKAHLLVVRAAFLSMLGPVFQKRPVRMFQIANLGKEVPTRVAFLGEKELGFPFFGHKKSTWYTWSI